MWIKAALSAQHLGLALMIGGLLALGAFTAPVLFKSFDRDAAGQAMAVIFRRYDTVLLVSLGLVVLGEVVRFKLLPLTGMGTLTWVRLGLTAVLAVTVLLSTLGTNATLTRLYAQQQQHTPAFHATHKQSEGLAKGQLLLAIGIMVLSLLA
jgi:hypothetical protein